MFTVAKSKKKSSCKAELISDSFRIFNQHDQKKKLFCRYNRVEYCVPKDPTVCGFVPCIGRENTGDDRKMHD